jgi:hypothetical protein
VPDLFPEDFGKRLERYTALGLKENNLNFLNETQLKKSHHLSKVTDYLVENDILIECKATELHPRSGVLRTPNILTNELNSSIIKAYCQLLSTATSLNRNKEWFGIIITYREMYLGFGSDAWNEFMESTVEKFANENNIDLNVLPPKNLFFVTIEYWDYMMQVIKEGKGSLKEILIKGRELNSSPNPVDRVFLIEQVLKKHFKIQSLDLSYLNRAHKMINIIPQDSA